MKSDYECEAEVGGPDLGYRDPAIRDDDDGNGEGVLLATASRHDSNMRPTV
jgi:hypothetical protein